MLTIYTKTRTEARNFSKGNENMKPRENKKVPGAECPWPVEVLGVSTADLYKLVDRVDKCPTMTWMYDGEMPNRPVVEKPKDLNDMAKARIFWNENKEWITNQKPKVVQDRISSELGIQRNYCRAVYYKLK